LAFWRFLSAAAIRAVIVQLEFFNRYWFDLYIYRNTVFRLADGWCWFVMREKYCWLVADKPSEQGDDVFAVILNLWSERQATDDEVVFLIHHMIGSYLFSISPTEDKKDLATRTGGPHHLDANPTRGVYCGLSLHCAVQRLRCRSGCSHHLGNLGTSSANFSLG
jgi:hypothetical protein